MFWEPWFYIYVCVCVCMWELPENQRVSGSISSNWPTLSSTVMDKVTFVHVAVELFFQDYAG